MAYDIPDEIRYREKIVANLDSRQVVYAIAFAIAALLSYRLPFEGELKLVFPAFFAISGIGFVFLGLDTRLLDLVAYFTNIRKAPHNSKRAQKFFSVSDIGEDTVFLDDGTRLAVIEVQPVNLAFLDEGRKKAILANYKAFLNQLSTPVQVLIRTNNVSLDRYFDLNALGSTDSRHGLLELYSDFRVFQEDFLDDRGVKERRYFVIIPLRDKMHEETLASRLEELVSITLEKLANCSLEAKRVKGDGLSELLESFAEDGAIEPEEIELNDEKDRSDDVTRDILTPSFDIRKDQAIINGEYHRIIRVNGYPREVEDGWLQAFLSKNDSYDISIHIAPTTISGMLVRLHNQIIQQASDLLMSTAKGTPNPSLEIKKSDTMKVYDSLYKGKEKLFSVSLYVDAKAPDPKQLSLLTERCKSNLNAQLMIPRIAEWRMADGIKSALPLAKDALQAQREFLTDSLGATFPFISTVDTRKNGILFAHDSDTLNPIFIDFDRMSNKHFFIIGISGSGKSYTSKYLIMQQLFKENTTIFILDPNGEYSALCEALSGQVIELSRDSTSMINLFDLAGQDYGDKMLGLLSAFDIIVGGLTESQKGVLNRVLSKAYQHRGIKHDDPSTWKKRPPTFSGIKQALSELRKEASEKKDSLKDPSVEALLNRVDLYCAGGIFGFLDRKSKLRLDRNFVCFDLSKLPQAVKTLMMFTVLEYINREIRKDRKAKVVLIDEGWSLLRSREASGYILDLVKTSRKFNTSLGFVTQEIEDLLRSRTGRSILNTSSIKILMRQNPTNIDLIAESLKLNEQTKNFLLGAPSGHGVLITEQNIHKFFVKAPEKLHSLITTHPNESQGERKAKQKIRGNPRLLDSGIHMEKDLSQKDIVFLLANGYKEVKDRLSRRGGSAWYLVKRRHNESPKHAFLCWSIYEALRERYEKVEMSTTSAGDVLVEINGKKIAFEVETGSFYGKKRMEEIEKKFERVRREFTDYFIVVTKWNEKRKYERFGKVITREGIPAIFDTLPNNKLVEG